MAPARQGIFVQRENDKGVQQGWVGGWLEIDQMAGTITATPRGILGGKWQIVIHPEQLTNFGIMMISDVSQMGMMYGGGLIGYGMAALMSRWVKMPALKLDQQNAEMGQRLLGIRGVGFMPRQTTRKIANQIADLLQQRGYKGPMPNLADDEPWKFPIVPVVIGCGAVIVLVLAVIVCVALASSTGSSGQ